MRLQISEKLAQIHLNQKSDGTKADREAIERALAEFRSKMAQTQAEMEIDLKAQLEVTLGVFLPSLAVDALF